MASSPHSPRDRLKDLLSRLGSGRFSDKDSSSPRPTPNHSPGGSRVSLSRLLKRSSSVNEGSQSPLDRNRLSDRGLFSGVVELRRGLQIEGVTVSQDETNLDDLLDNVAGETPGAAATPPGSPSSTRGNDSSVQYVHRHTGSTSSSLSQSPRRSYRGHSPKRGTRLSDYTSTGHQRDAKERRGSAPALPNFSSVPAYRRDWLLQCLDRREREFTSTRGVRIACSTWNVNAKKPAGAGPDALKQWLVPEGEAKADIYAIGLQEMVDLNAVNVAVDKKSASRSNQWEMALQATLGSSYCMIGKKHLVGIWLCIFVRFELTSAVTDLRTGTVTAGMLGVMGNKGAVGISLYLHDSPICFVCTHLAAHRNNVSARNDNYYKVLHNMSFSKETSFEESFFPLEFQENSLPIINWRNLPQWGGGLAVEELDILDHSFAFWFGDLNYRIAVGVPMNEIFGCAETANLAFLKERDQLNLARAAKESFDIFDEGEIFFSPTYKYQPGTHVYDRREGEKKQRAPAWCDRVLSWTREPQLLSQVLYRRSEEPKTSDHKPVVAAYVADIKIIDPVQRDIIYHQLLKEVDKAGDEAMPSLSQVELTFPTEGQITFDEIRYKVEAQTSFWIQNVGKAVAHYRMYSGRAPDIRLREATQGHVFRNSLERAQLNYPTWYAVFPHQGVIIPGERVEVKLYATVGETTVRAIRSGAEDLDDTLIIRFADGQSHSVPVRGRYIKSAYGSTLVELMESSLPMRHRIAGIVDDQDDRPVVPRQLWRMIDSLMRGEEGWGLGADGIFAQEGIKEEVEAIREAIDTGEDFPAHGCHSMCEALVSLLISLSASVIPSAPSGFHLAGRDCSHNGEALTDVLLRSLPQENCSTFLYVVHFFREVLKHKDENGLSTDLAVTILRGCTAPFEMRVVPEKSDALDAVLWYLLTCIHMPSI